MQSKLGKCSFIFGICSMPLVRVFGVKRDFTWVECMAHAIGNKLWRFTYMHIHITKVTSQLGLTEPVGGSPRREAQECQLRRLITLSTWPRGQITVSLW